MKKTILTLFVIGAPFLLYAQNEIASQTKSNQYRTLKLPYDSDIKEDVSMESENIQMASSDSSSTSPLGKKETRRRKVLMAERSGSSSRSKASAK